MAEVHLPFKLGLVEKHGELRMIACEVGYLVGDQGVPGFLMILQIDMALCAVHI